MAPKVMGVAVASKRYENDACEWAEGRRVPRDVRSSPPEREIIVGGCPIQGGTRLSVAPSLHTNTGGKYLMFFEGKARSRRGDLLALRGKGAVPPVQPAPVSVVVVGSLLWFARITGESTRR